MERREGDCRGVRESDRMLEVALGVDRNLVLLSEDRALCPKKHVVEAGRGVRRKSCVDVCQLLAPTRTSELRDPAGILRRRETRPKRGCSSIPGETPIIGRPRLAVVKLDQPLPHLSVNSGWLLHGQIRDIRFDRNVRAVSCG